MPKVSAWGDTIFIAFSIAMAAQRWPETSDMYIKSMRFAGIVLKFFFPAELNKGAGYLGVELFAF